jgi:nitroreductase
MEFADVVRRRRMVRNYDPDRPVPGELVELVLRNATRAPSAGFAQGWSFLVLRDDADRAAFWAATTDGGPPDSWLSGLQRAPVLIVCLSDKDTYLARYAEGDKGWTDRDEARWPVPYWDIDTGMAALLMLLTAVDQGVGGCFFGVPPEYMAAVHETFGIPPALTPIGVVSLGYRAPDRPGSAGKRTRRGLDEVAFEGRWGEPLRLVEE